jgi:hypothetical protein
MFRDITPVELLQAERIQQPMKLPPSSLELGGAGCPVERLQLWNIPALVPARR